MRDIIRKILKEARDLPDWYVEWEKLPREGRIEGIEKRKFHILKLTPKIIKFFKEKFGDSLERIEVGEKGVHYGHESHSTNVVLFKFYFNDNMNIHNIKKEIIYDIENFFNIQLEYYGVPLDLEFYVKTWKPF